MIHAVQTDALTTMTMNSDDLAALSPANEAELHTLETSWENGVLRQHAERVLTFVERHRAELREQAGSARDAATLLMITKRHIARAGAVHLPSEMRDQAKEIQDEIWIRGERGEYDRTNIAFEWTSQHAAAWRQWRLKEYVFVVDRCAPEIVARLGG